MTPRPEQDGWWDPYAQYQRKPRHMVVGGAEKRSLGN